MQITGKISTFLKYVMTHFIVFIIPVILLVLFFTNTMLGSYTQDLRNKNLNLLQNMVEDFDARLVQIEKILLDMESDYDLAGYRAEDNVINRMKTQMRLKSYWVANGTFDELIYYVRGYDYLISSRTSYPVDLFIGSNFTYPQWTREDFQKDINSLNSMKWIFNGTNLSSNKNNILTLMYPMPLTTGTSYGSALFMLDMKLMAEEMKGSLPFGNAQVMILDEKDSLLASTSPIGEAYGKWRPQLGDEGSQNPFYSFKDGNRKYLRTMTKSKYFGWTFVTVIPSDEVLSSVIQMRNDLVASIIFVMLLGLMVVYLFARINYAPIRSLSDFLRGQMLLTAEGRSEIDSARLAIQNLNERSKELTKKLDDNISHSMELILFKLINGEYLSHEELLADFERAGIREDSKEFMWSTGKPYHIVVIRIHEWLKLSRADMGKAVETLYRYITCRYFAMITYKMVEGSIVALLKTEELKTEGFKAEEQETRELKTVDREELLRGFLEEIRNKLYDEYNLSCLITIGSKQVEMAQAYQSYREAMNALRYIEEGDDLKNSAVIFAKDIDELRRYNEQMYRHEIESMVQAIGLESENQLENALKVLISRINTTTSKAFHIRLICMDAANALISAVNKKYMGFMDVVPLYDKLNAITQAALAENSITILCDMVSDVKRILTSGIAPKGNSMLINQVMEYIAGHYMNHDFSINHLVDRFDISVNNLSQRFKRHTGITPMQYVTMLRVNKAKELLIRTDFSLKLIIESVGYVDETTLIRNFKAQVGITPGRYREMSRSMDDHAGGT